MTHTDNTTRIIPQKEVKDAFYKYVEQHPEVIIESDNILRLTIHTHQSLMQSHPEALREGISKDIFDGALIKNCVAMRLNPALVSHASEIMTDNAQLITAKVQPKPKTQVVRERVVFCLDSLLMVDRKILDLSSNLLL